MHFVKSMKHKTIKTIPGKTLIVLHNRTSFVTNWFTDALTFTLSE